MFTRYWNYVFNQESSPKQADATDSESFAMVDASSDARSSLSAPTTDDAGESELYTCSVDNTIIIDKTMSKSEKLSTDDPADYVIGKYAGSVSLVIPATIRQVGDFIGRWRADTHTDWRINDNIAIYCRGDTVKVVITMSDGFVLSQLYYDAGVFINELSALVDAARDTTITVSGNDSGNDSGNESLEESLNEESIDDSSVVAFPPSMVADDMSADEKRRKLTNLTKLRLAAGLPSDMMTPLERTLFVETFYDDGSNDNYGGTSEESETTVDCCGGQECI